MGRLGWTTKRRKTDPFEPHPRFEEAGIARYWPDTFFVDISEYPQKVQSFEGHELSLTSEGNLDIFVALAARMHEQVHWLQSAGTTFGRFLALNCITTADLAEAILTTIEPSERTELDDARRLGRAPAARTKQGKLTHLLGYSTTVQSLFDHWWASVAVEVFLTDNNITLLGAVDPQFLVGLAHRYVVAGNMIKTVFNSPDQGFLKKTKNCGPIGRFPNLDALRHISVRHIEEAAALTVQHLFNLRVAASLPGDRSIEFRARVAAWTADRFFNNRNHLYTAALEVFLKNAPAMNDLRSLELFILICDIALNPGIPDKSDALSMDWYDFHPVLRFHKLIQCLSGFIPNEDGLENHLRLPGGSLSGID